MRMDSLCGHFLDLRSKTDVGEQIEVIVAKDPDVSQSVWAFQRLCMQGVNIEKLNTLSYIMSD